MTEQNTHGHHTTAAQALQGADLTGRLAVVTGGYSGLGLAATRALSAAGAHVLVGARRPGTAAEALDGITGADVDRLDLGDLDSVAAFAARLLATGRGVDIVINNAGIMACPETRVGPGWEAHFATNHLGHYALVNHLAPALTDTARVVAVASSGHFLSGIRWDDPHFTTGYDGWLAYGQSKTANALFALHLDGLLPARSHAYAVHPGSILTPLQRHVPHQTQADLGWITPDGSLPPGFKTPEQGAATAVWAATSPDLDGHGGAYCQDCRLARPAETDDMLTGGYKPWVRDREAAARLWDLSAAQTGIDAFA